MYRNSLALINCGLLLLTLTACSKINDAPGAAPPGSPNVPATIAQATPEAVVRASAAGVEMQAGGSAEAAVRLSIADGYHINANPPTYSYLIATQLNVAPDKSITVDQPMYPPAVTRKFAFAEKPLAVYEHEATIKLPLHADSAAAKGTRSLEAKLRVQPCDETACYPPQTIATSIPVNIK